ncbi:MAG: helix-turn-helix domain-containing protein [Acetobacteraceae bacterium]|nr:helix-turn-helix domain-containing protein [Acetobacteraceae bacterium]
MQSRFPANILSPGVGSGCLPGERDVFPHRLGRSENELEALARLQQWKHLAWAAAMHGQAVELRRRLSGGGRRAGDQDALDALVTDALRRLSVVEGQFAALLDRLCDGSLTLTGRAADEPPGTRTDFASPWWQQVLGSGRKRSTARLANWRAQDVLHLVGSRPRIWRELAIMPGTPQSARKDAASDGAPREVMSSREAAAFLGISERSLQRFRIEGGGPVFVRLGQTRVSYLRADLVAWLHSRRASSTSEETASAERRA